MIQRQPLLKHTQIIRLMRLLDMLYKPSELADEIGVNVDTVYRSYIPAGLPVIRDEDGHFWIHGPAFVAWARETIAQKKAKRQGLPEGHAWCMTCNRPVKITALRVRSISRYSELVQGTCPACGKTVNRLRKPVLPSPSDALPDGEGLGVGS
jgi:hypothetical protein